MDHRINQRVPFESYEWIFFCFFSIVVVSRQLDPHLALEKPPLVVPVARKALCVAKSPPSWQCWDLAPHASSYCSSPTEPPPPCKAVDPSSPWKPHPLGEKEFLKGEFIERGEEGGEREEKRAVTAQRFCIRRSRNEGGEFTFQILNLIFSFLSSIYVLLNFVSWFYKTLFGYRKRNGKSFIINTSFICYI